MFKLKIIDEFFYVIFEFFTNKFRCESKIFDCCIPQISFVNNTKLFVFHDNLIPLYFTSKQQ